MRFFILLFALTLSGCIPDELACAGKCFYRENYAGAIREIDVFLGAQKDINDDQSKLYRAIALFYRGISKRAYTILHSKSSLEVYTTEDIVRDYILSSQLNPDLLCLYFHLGLEYVLDGQCEKATACLSRFEREVRTGVNADVKKQFDGECIFKKSCKLADELLRNMCSTPMIITDAEQRKIVMAYYKDVLFRKSKYHQLHNIRLLINKYPISRFKFLLDSTDFESKYDYIDKNVECGMDYLILRGSIADYNALLKILNRNGFEEWRYIEHPEGIKIICKMGICVYKGMNNDPIAICVKRIKFDRVLVVIYSRESHSFCCVVCRENSPEFKYLSERIGI